METVTLTFEDIKARYRVSESTARKILREIRDYTKSVLPRGRCLAIECEMWETKNFKKEEKQ